ncbi:MAG TPA: hypothetical protein VNZ62_05400 [Capillimicrobium sp.]|nr:hypothetical protein [Capillimicrobium sp.]
MSTPPREPIFQTWQQQAFAIGMSALLPLVGVLLSLWLLAQGARRDGVVALAAAVLGAIVWWVVIG